MAWESSGDQEDGPAGGDPQDAIPPEWILELERVAAEEAARRAERKRRITIISAAIPATIVVGVLITLGVLSIRKPGPIVLPSAVTSFAKTLPASQRPNAAGLTVVDGEFAPNTWRVAWVTQDAGFCFAFVHQSEPAQTMCDAPRSVTTAQMRIVGELSDDGLNPPELITCGYTTGAAPYVEINHGAVVGTVTPMTGSNLSGYCLQLPDDVAPGAPFSVTTFIVITNENRKDGSAGDVTATYP
ncbi:hypothetical protein KDK95_05420 [Actinospica sp. MGRD01-02]|uniref:Uncharacterized protein n=1 Tax=Actinospica acidithermotolerans TaxID=2828514 RepID=A0A941E894_9ACTN|nr:hypothetical protein [Actinospica acidithermotolerans]MBR7825738.1 hypothetical protein [Actinospica acidithermotolerans]